MADTKKSSKTSERGSSEVWTDEEKKAMQEHAKDVKKSRSGKADPTAECLAKIAEMTGSDREMAERVHAIVLEAAPDLQPGTWYGMPAYKTTEGKLICFFQSAAKFKARYATFGFEQNANIDEGTMWPTSWALTKITESEEKRLSELVKKAVS